MTNASGNSSKVVPITGCSSPAGIGFASARALARAGHRVWATVRDLAKAEALSADVDRERLRVRFLDLDDRSNFLTDDGDSALGRA